MSAPSEIAQFSTADAERYPAFVELAGKLAAVVGGLARVDHYLWKTDALATYAATLYPVPCTLCPVP